MEPRWLEIRLQQAADAESYRASYDLLHRRAEIGMRDSFYDWILDLLAIQPGQHLLDVAGGNGALARRARLRQIPAMTLDLSFDASQQSQQGSIVGDGHCLPFGANVFDRVASIGSLEHYTNPLLGASELARVLQPDGLACVLLPNLFSLLGNVWNVFRTGHTFIDRQPIQRYAALEDWQTVLQAAGLRVERVVKFEREWPRYIRDAAWYLEHPKSLARLILTPFVPLRLAACHVFMCRKRA